MQVYAEVMKVDWLVFTKKETNKKKLWLSTKYIIISVKLIPLENCFVDLVVFPFKSKD